MNCRWCTFSISYKLIPYYVHLLLYFHLIVIGRWDFFFSCPLYFFPYSHFFSYLLRLFLYLISFLLFPCASVWENTLAWVPNFQYHSEWYLLFLNTKWSKSLLSKTNYNNNYLSFQCCAAVWVAPHPHPPDEKPHQIPEGQSITILAG